MSLHLGFYNTSSSRTHVGFQFSTHASAGGNVAPSSAIDAADIRIYRAADGAAFSATQRSSANGITVTSPFDSLTGFHDVDIDLTDNTDAGFYAAGYRYSVVLAPNDETIDSLVITGVVLAVFEIGVPVANVTQFGGTNGTFSGGRPEVNTTHAAGTAWGSGAITAASIAADAITAAKIADGSIDAATFAAGAITASAIAAEAITDAKVASDVTIASVTGAVGSVTGNVGGSVGSIATGGITASSFAAGAIDNTAIAADAIGSSELAASAVTEIQNGLATQTSVDTIDGIVDAIKLKTDNLPSDPADASDIAAAFSTVNTTLSTIAGYIDTEIGTLQSTLNGVVTTLGVAGAGLSAVPWNAAWDAEVQSECADAVAADKTGYKLASDGLDSVATTAPSGVASNFREMVVQTWRRWFKKTVYDIDDNNIKTFADDDSTVVTTQTVAVSATEETQGAAS